MNFTSKYNLGDRVAIINDTTVLLPPEQCSACEGLGTCNLAGDSFQCPKCKGQKETQRTGSGWLIVERGTVGKIECQTVTESDEHTWRTENVARDGVIYRCMLNRSGSGTVYFEDQLQPPETAQAECDRRNAERHGPTVVIKPYYARGW